MSDNDPFRGLAALRKMQVPDRLKRVWPALMDIAWSKLTAGEIDRSCVERDEDDAPCGKCPACVVRRAFIEIGKVTP